MRKSMHCIALRRHILLICEPHARVGLDALQRSTTWGDTRIDPSSIRASATRWKCIQQPMKLPFAVMPLSREYLPSPPWTTRSSLRQLGRFIACGRWTARPTGIRGPGKTHGRRWQMQYVELLCAQQIFVTSLYMYEQIGEGVKIEECIKRWKTLRDHFVRELKKKKKPSGEAGPEFKSSWHLFDLLIFLTDTVRHRL